MFCVQKETAGCNRDVTQVTQAVVALQQLPLCDELPSRSVCGTLKINMKDARRNCQSSIMSSVSNASRNLYCMVHVTGIKIDNCTIDFYVYVYRVIRNDCRGFNNLPPRSPDATPCDFFLWGYVKDQIYVPPLPASIPELKVHIRTAIETITADDMLQTVWTNSIIVLMFVESQRLHK